MKYISILGSSRSDGHTRSILDIVNQKMGADMIDLKTKNIAYFDYDNAYPNNDEFIAVFEELLTYDVWIFGTPVYWYSMSAKLKTFFDRITDVLKFRKDLKDQLSAVSMAAISCGSADDLNEGFFVPFESSAEYLGMGYLGDMHSWIDRNNIVSDEVKEKVLSFCDTIQEKTLVKN